MSASAECKVDRTGWPAGPWDAEPDRVEWRHAGLPCLMVRNHGGAWCGYAAVSPGHPAYGNGDIDVDVHGGVTYSKCCEGEICHVPDPGEPDNVFWIGFDTAHGGDLVPRHETHRALPGYPQWPDGMPRDTYRDQAYVTAEVNSLAEQLAAMGAVGPGQADTSPSVASAAPCVHGSPLPAAV